MVNTYGGNMPDAIGIPENELRHAAELSVCKINIDSDIRLAMTGNIRKYFAEHPDHFDPRQYLKPARQITSIPDSISSPQDRLSRIWSLTRSSTCSEALERPDQKSVICGCRTKKFLGRQPLLLESDGWAR